MFDNLWKNGGVVFDIVLIGKGLDGSMLPEKFLERMQRMLGEEYGAFLESFGQERYQALRLNPLKLGADGRSAAEALGGGRCLPPAGSSGEPVPKTDSLLSPESERTLSPEGGSPLLPKGESPLSPGAGGAKDFAHLAKVPWAENGYYYQPGDQPGKHPYHEAGLYYIQEPSAMAPAELLEVQPEERVLDLCAAPGGKSTQIAAKLQGRGVLFCNEIHSARAKILSENIERMGICNACVTNEPPERLAEFFPEYFDKILVDAPCSGEGMFRKNDAACGEWSQENVALCAERQDGILDCAARMLRPGGRLVYSTCTFAPEEDEGSVGRFLQRHGEFSVLPADKAGLGLWEAAGSGETIGSDRAVCSGETIGGDRAVCSGNAIGSDRTAGSCKTIGGNDAAGNRAAACDKALDEVPEWFPGEASGLKGTLRLWPHRIKGEGHFAAVLQKAGDVPQGYSGSAVNGTIKGLSEKELEKLTEFREFCDDMLRFSMPHFKAPAVYIRFGDNLYLVPEGMPSLKGLKVLRPGLHLGEIKKGRFEPSHALALALAPKDAAHIWNMAYGDSRIRDYLRGGTFPAEGEKGWYLICVDGFSIGWGKLAGGIMKNHYPRGLRRS